MSAATLLPAGLRVTPRLDRWLSISPEGHVTLSPGKVEIGQGILTALAQICADELDIAIERVRLRPADTASSPNEGVTSGSLSVSDCGLSVRLAAAQTRGLFLAEAARLLSVPQEALSVEDGAITGPGNLATSYWELAGKVSLACSADPAVRAKEPGDRTLAGRPVPRIDLAGKVFGTRPFIHDLDEPGLLHGRVLRPPRPGATLESLDEAALAGLDGLVAWVRDGSFLGLVCESEVQAEAALGRLATAARWTGGFELPDQHDLCAWLQAEPAEASVVDLREGPQPSPATRRLVRRYLKPYLAHASIGPSCAIAIWAEDGLRIVTHSQGVFNLRADLALVFGLPENDIVVGHAEGAGCYGHNGADDAALDAALLARAVPGRPVRLRWSRADELARSPFGAAMAIEIAADIGADGRVAGWSHEIWSNGYVARPGRAGSPALLASFDLEKPFPLYISQDPPLAGGGGAQRNAVPLYDFPSWRIAKNRLLTMPLRTSSMRALGAFGNVFAIESMMDELAHEQGEDPLAFRLRHLGDARARAVLERAAAMADGGAAVPEGRGRGLAFARYKNTGAYCAVVAEIDLAAEPRATQLWIAVDVGEAINPDGVANQIEGGAVQATSWTLKEEVAFSREAVTSTSWETYTILRFSEVPEVTVEIVPRPDLPPLGAGECAQGPTAAALANAVHAALGVRVRQMPITRDRIIAAME
ncbi:molybdopterin cofactor-binding domain-containing protein [Bosea sp. (in: a-proteobacteria)]|uniref:molybdopterin cofactor-binding domain-containing protein n=1 Tax=Bosea sp. (in: a-proteobacteria) TaxID=1871050 RepID=UPI002B46EF59|nr:molybdopterin cofactor-binding domain-containing protein [Bosea sp. (in: a-proteobacteria)]WRH58828.1 MAG: molybdopterin cofactor-binding domain-containing protein [Bosea sp. (in: a-proteobacteria)]